MKNSVGSRTPIADNNDATVVVYVASSGRLQTNAVTCNWKGLKIHILTRQPNHWINNYTFSAWDCNYLLKFLIYFELLNKRYNCHLCVRNELNSQNDSFWGHTRLHKAIQGCIRPYKANTAIQHHNMPQKHIYCSLAQFLFDLEHFSLMFPREEEQQQQSFF